MATNPDEQRAQWLSRRRQGLGSSDAPAVCLPARTPGVYRTPLHVYLDKIGEAVEHKRPELAWGLKLEEVVACAFGEETGLQVRRLGDIVQHPRYTWMLATPDWEVPGESAVLELKTARTAEGWGPSGSDLFPDGYGVQVQHQIEVLGCAHAYLAVLIGGSDFRHYRLERNQRLIDSILAIEEEFWGRVVLRQPPPPDWEHPDSPDLLSQLHRPHEGSPAVELDALDAMLVDEYQVLGAEIRARETRRKRCRAQIDERLGAATTGTLADGRVLRRSVVHTKGYWREPGESVKLTITNPKENG